MSGLQFFIVLFGGFSLGSSITDMIWTARDHKRQLREEYKARVSK